MVEKGVVINAGEDERLIKPSKEMTDAERLEATRTGSVFSAIFNIVNGVVGTGTLSMAYTVYCTGLVTGLAICAALVVVSVITLLINIKCSSAKGGIRTYQECMGIYCGKFWKTMVELTLMFYSSGVLCSYFVVMGEFIKPVIDTLTFPNNDYFFNDQKVIVLFFSILLIYPLTLLREIKFLSFTSFIAIGGIAYLTIFIVVIGIRHIVVGDLGDGIGDLMLIQLDTYTGTFYPLIFLAAPIQCFGYVCQAMLFPITFEVKNGNSKKYIFIVLVSLTCISLIYLLNAVFGFISFGTEVRDNILSNFPGGDIFANIGRIAVGMSIVFSFPVQCYTVRLAIVSLVFGNGKVLSTGMYLLIQTVYFGIVLCVALFVSKISIVLGYNGAIGANALMYFFPAILAWKALPQFYPKYTILCRLLSLALLVFFCYFCLTGTIASTFTLINSFKGE